MNKHLIHILPILLAFFAGSLQAQVTPACPFPAPPGGESCQSTCVYCDLDGYHGINGSFPSGGNTVCGQITLHNDQWFGFVAGSTEIDFTVTSSLCQNGDGLQMAIFESCGASDAIVCNPGSAGSGGTPMNLFYSNFVPGRTYYLMIDGWTGDVCDFDIDVTQGSVAAPQPQQPTQIFGPQEVCPGAVVVYSVPPTPGVGYYQWSVPAGASINGGSNHATLEAPDGNVVTVSFANTGGSVCVQVGNGCFPATSALCRNIVNKPIPPTILPDVAYLETDLPVVWDQPPFYTVSTPGTFTFTSAGLDSHLGCDSTVKQTIKIVPMGPSVATGNLFEDTDNDGVWDSNEPAYTDPVVLTASGGKTPFAQTNGYYAFTGLAVGDTIWIAIPGSGASFNPGFHVFTGQNQGYDFGIVFPPPSPFAASGLIFNDTNNNGIFDAGETPYAFGAVVKTSDGQLTTSKSNGTFLTGDLAPGDTIRVVPPVTGVVANPPFRLFAGGLPQTYDFGLFTPQPGYDFWVNITHTTVFRPGFTTQLKLTVRNCTPHTSPPVAGWVILPGFLTPGTSYPPPTTSIGDTLIWDFPPLGAYQVGTAYLDVYVPVGTPVGTPVKIEARVLPVADDLTPANNFYTLHSTVVGSYDPNDKQVTPAYVTPPMLSGGLPFEYTIRFQNTGNYPAEFIRIIDTLGAGVDPASFRFISSSHPCTWKVKGTGVVEFFFPNIQLPDSSSNEPASHGFVTFTVQPRPGLPLGTSVENFCDIYFDFNDPVRTNTAGTQVVYFLPGDGLQLNSKRLAVRPSPAAYHIFCDWGFPAPADGRIRLFDLGGLPRLEAAVGAGASYLGGVDVQTLPPGLYFVLLEAGNVVLANKVIIVRADILGDD